MRYFLINIIDGNTDLIELVASFLPSDGCAKLTNEKGETPIHAAVKSHLKRDSSFKVLSALLKIGLVDSSQKDKSSKRACDYLQPSDCRSKLLQEYSSKYLKPTKKTKRKKKSKQYAKTEFKVKPESKVTTVSQHVIPPDGIISAITCQNLEISSPHEEKVIPKKEYEECSLADKLSYHMDRLKNQDNSYFKVQDETQTCQELEQTSYSSLSQLTSPPKDQLLTSSSKISKKNLICSSEIGSNILATEGIDSSSKLLNEDCPSIFWKEFGSDLNGLPSFDDLPWEVEITRNVVKFFKNSKKYSYADRMSAAQVIYKLAEGKRSVSLSKQVKRTANVCLYESRITHAGRMLWEKAISYSSKLTGQSETAVYTQVIRVWEIILDHDDLNRRINFCIEQIEQSYTRGHLASVCRSLKPISHCISKESGFIRGREVFEFPNFYMLLSQKQVNPEYRFVPAASSKDAEYNVTTFYSFDSMTVKSMIAGVNERRDYPFKEWQKENEIIRMKSNVAILLLGRSGTGKTTCCLYRLWNEFKNHWDPDSKTFQWKIPRKCLISSKLGDFLLKFDSEVQTTCSTDTESLEGELNNGVEPHVLENLCSSFTDEDNGVVEVVEEHLHQIFITKNYVLCDQMKKRFYAMAAAHGFLENHLPFEGITLPNDFSKFNDFSFPAFLTARQFYILLDNSLGDGKKFFPRDECGNLQVKIASLDYDHEDEDTLWDFEESDSDDDDIEMLNYSSEKPAQRQHLEKWTEVTALYFKEIIWPKIAFQCELKKVIDPMLVWLEIQSFIKGSALTIAKGSPLDLDEYKSIGNRIAPNFSSHREIIYKLYQCYQQYKQNQRHTYVLFDECDLIMDLHQRLKATTDVVWSIHSVYVDEVQDFTQAELAIFIHSCRDPNSMFFTGDTAQSIMRGIAFRFQDLRNHFYMLNSKNVSVSVPQQPLSLNVNYRSHSGILKLAGSVIDLIKEFFKDSIDHLPDDEGMFPGPIPVFLDSCKEDDLSLLLSTSKRECSAIEFGAHQVILVQSKEAKEKLPQILKGAIVLTIFESKGLEFDDVLIYNFFSDSNVS